MREVGPELSRVIRLSRYFGRQAERHPKHAKTPARTQASSGGRCREVFFFALGFETELNLGL